VPFKLGKLETFVPVAQEQHWLHPAIISMKNTLEGTRDTHQERELSKIQEQQWLWTCKNKEETRTNPRRARMKRKQDPILDAIYYSRDEINSRNRKFENIAGRCARTNHCVREWEGYFLLCCGRALYCRPMRKLQRN
jgi:hypothetical protein